MMYQFATVQNNQVTKPDRGRSGLGPNQILPDYSREIEEGGNDGSRMADANSFKWKSMQGCMKQL